MLGYTIISTSVVEAKKFCLVRVDEHKLDCLVCTWLNTRGGLKLQIRGIGHPKKVFDFGKNSEDRNVEHEIYVVR